jgi:hypothetical protein
MTSILSVVIMMMLWTWGITPLWVNVVGTILLSWSIFFEILYLCWRVDDEQIDR